MTGPIGADDEIRAAAERRNAHKYNVRAAKAVWRAAVENSRQAVSMSQCAS
jgi:hypothetical protein